MIKKKSLWVNWENPNVTRGRPTLACVRRECWKNIETVYSDVLSDIQLGQVVTYSAGSHLPGSGGPVSVNTWRRCTKVKISWANTNDTRSCANSWAAHTHTKTRQGEEKFDGKKIRSRRRFGRCSRPADDADDSKKSCNKREIYTNELVSWKKNCLSRSRRRRLRLPVSRKQFDKVVVTWTRMRTFLRKWFQFVIRRTPSRLAINRAAFEWKVAERASRCCSRKRPVVSGNWRNATKKREELKKQNLEIFIRPKSIESGRLPAAAAAAQVNTGIAVFWLLLTLGPFTYYVTHFLAIFYPGPPPPPPFVTFFFKNFIGIMRKLQ